MTVTVSGTTITFNDATTQTTAPVNTNANVTSVSAGTGISVSSTTGAVVVSSTVSGGVSSINGQTGAVVTTDFNAIGSFVQAGLSTTSNLLPGATISGGSLYYATNISAVNNSYAVYTEGSQNTLPQSTQYGRRNNGNTGFQNPGGMSTLSGTWRLMSAATYARYSSYNSCDGQTTSAMASGFLVRVS